MTIINQGTATALTFDQGTRTAISTVNGTLQIVANVCNGSTGVGILDNLSTTSTVGTLQSNLYHLTYEGTSTSIFTVSGTDTSFWVDNTVGIDFHNELLKNNVKLAMKNNLLIKVNSRQKPLQTTAQIEEQRARLTLRDMLSEQDWRRYITNGFIMVKGSSDYWYQIFASSGVNVYKHGKKVHYICIHTDNACPPSDHVINMKLLVEFDELALWKGGNVKKIFNETNLGFQNNNINVNLVEHYRAMKNNVVIKNIYLTNSPNIFAIAC